MSTSDDTGALDRFDEFFPGAKQIAVQEEIEIEELFQSLGSDDSVLKRDLARRLVIEACQEPPIVLGKAAKKKLLALQEAAQAVMADHCLTEGLPLELLHVVSQLGSLRLEGQRGPRPKDAAARVARLLAQHFETLTGSPPTRITPVKDGVAQRSCGHFTQLLGEVYAVLRIDASPDSQARAAIKAMEKNGSESDQ
jgi:hypothetical protein